MKTFEVWINGEKKCVAGVSDEALLSVGLMWARDEVDLHVGGLENDEHLRWLQNEVELKVGDEVMFRIVKTDVVDEPTERSRSRTRVEKETEVRDYLAKARALLPIVDESQIAVFEHHLAQNHLIGAVDELGILGETRDVPAKFWRQLANACHALTQYEDRDRYKKKFREAK